MPVHPNNPTMKKPTPTKKKNAGRRTQICAALLAIYAGCSMASASQNKANNTIQLANGGSWVSGTVPGSGDTAIWDSTVTAANSVVLSNSMTWKGILISNPGGKVTISASITNPVAAANLTLNSGGIDLSAATQDLTVSNSVVVGPYYQAWNVAAGRTLKIGALVNKPGTGTATEGIVQFSTTGTTTLTNLNNLTIADSQGNPWATYGLSDWAATDASGNVIPVTYTAVSASTSTTFIQNADITGGYTQSGNGVFGSMRFADPGTAYIVNCGNTTFTPRGVLMAPGCAGGTITNGFMRPNRSSTAAATSFDFIQNSTAGDLTVAVNLANASSGAPVKLVKAGPGKMIVAVAGGYTGGTVVHAGTLQVNTGATLGATTGAGAVVINSGRLLFLTGANQGLPLVTVNSGGTNAIRVATANGSSFVGTNLLLAAGTTHLEFGWNTGIALSTTTAPMQASTLTNAGTAVIDIYAASLTVGQYPLVKYSSLIGGAGNYIIGALPLRTTGHIVTNAVNSSIDLVVDSTYQPLFWATGSGNWDTATTANWVTNAVNTTYQEVTTPFGTFGDSVKFEDSASGTAPITVNVANNVSPSSVAVSASKAYTISGNNAINGAGTLVKSGTGTLTLRTTNNFSGGLYVSNGIVNFASITNLGNGAINLVGGTLQYAAGNVDDISVRGVWFGPGGGTIDDGGNTLTFASAVGTSGPGGLTKTGSGSLTLTGTNKYSGNTVVNQGTLALAASTYITNSAAIIVNSGALLDSAASGVGLTLAGTSAQIVAGTGTINGNVISSNGIITPGTNGVVGTLTFAGNLTLAGGSLVLDLATNSSQRDLLSVGGALTINAGTVQLNVTGTLTNGVYKLIQYGSLSSPAGSSANLIVAGYSQPGKVLQLSDSTSGEIDLVVTSLGGASTVWQGNDASNPNNWDIETTANFTNSAGAPVVFVQGDKPTFDDTSSNPSVSLMAAVQPSSVTVNSSVNNYVFQDGTGSGAGKLTGAVGITKNGSSTLTIATANLNSGPTVINGGTVQVGNGGTLGDLGIGNITNNATLVFYQSDSHAVNGIISGTGSLTQQGSGTLTLAGNNAYSGFTYVTASGSLQVGTGGAAGALGSGAITNDGTLIFNHTGSFAVGGIKTGPSSAGTVDFNGAATVTLNAGNTYMNNTYVNNGTVKLAAAEAVPSGATVAGSSGWLVLDGGVTGGTFDLNGFNQSVNALSGIAGTVNGLITNSSASATTTNVLNVLNGNGNTYNGLIGDNASGAKVQLTLGGTTELILNGINTYSAGTIVGGTATIGVGRSGQIGTGGITLSNGTTFFLHGASSAPQPFPGNQITIPDGHAATFNNSGGLGGSAYNGSVYGGPNSTNFIAGSISEQAASLQQYANFPGTVQILTGATLRYSATANLNNGGPNTTFDIEGTGVLQTRNAGTVWVGALTGNGFINNPQANTGTGTFIIGTKNVDSTFSGTISGTNNLVKAGTAKLTLDGTLSYVGTTTVSNGILVVADASNNSVSLDNSPSLTLAGSTATIDVSGRTDGTLNLGNTQAQTLTGFGNIYGSLFEAATTINNLWLGVLTVTNVATIDGQLNLQINDTNSPNCSELAAHAFVNGGSLNLTVANVGSTNLVAGDTFHLFNQGLPGSFTLTLPPLPSTQLYWTNTLATDGTIAVKSLVATNPTNLTASVSGGVLTLSWPADHTGWRLLVQTNNLANGISTNAADWSSVAGSASLNSTNLPVDATKPTEFYRLVYP